MSLRKTRQSRSAAGFIALMLPLLAFADTVGVVVKNTATNAVPVTGNVNATVQGTPNVTATISGTPTVNIGTMPTAPNPEKSPVYYQEGAAGGASILSQFANIPPNTMFVIESESVFCFVTQGTQLLYAFLAGSEGRLYLPFQKTGTDGTYDYYVASLSNRMYAQTSGSIAGDLFFDFFGRPPTGATTPVTSCDVWVMGHLVPLP
jgi:hypothetical protein